MKRVGKIYSKIIDKNNLYLAIKKASKGKCKRRNVQNVQNHISKSVDYLYKILSEETFIPTKRRKFDNTRRSTKKRKNY